MPNMPTRLLRSVIRLHKTLTYPRSEPTPSKFVTKNTWSIIARWPIRRAGERGKFRLPYPGVDESKSPRLYPSILRFERESEALPSRIDSLL